MLEINPEFYSVWNFRRQIFSSLIKASRDTVGTALWGELQLLEGAIAKNAKAYCLWMHRLWVIDRLVELGDTEVLAKELVLCTKFLKLDERNFHCWGYRLAISGRAKTSHADGLAFTTEKVNANFSKHSAWHYRENLVGLFRSLIGLFRGLF